MPDVRHIICRHSIASRVAEYTLTLEKLLSTVAIISLKTDYGSSVKASARKGEGVWPNSDKSGQGGVGLNECGSLQRVAVYGT